MQNSYSVSSQILWTVESKGISIINKNTNVLTLLNNTESIIWDLLYRHNNLEEIVDMVSNILKISVTKAQSTISICIDKWIKSEFLLIN